MTDSAKRRSELLHSRSAAFAEVAVKNIQLEFPSDIQQVMREPGDFPTRPRELHPAFFGSFDWHSCVEMHWMLVRLLRAVPESVPADRVRAALDALLTEEALAGEAATFRAGRGGGRRARPYGWGWLLTLAHELAVWPEDADARRWSHYLDPLADSIAEAYVAWLPKSTYPNRVGVHTNTSFGLSRALPYARLRADRGDTALLEAITEAAERWYGADEDYPGGWEPSGSDFLSAALTEAELMASLWPRERFLPWFDRFLPGVAERSPATLFTPATVSDDADGQIAHLHGLNLSRAWCWRRLAEALPEDDPRVPILLESAAAQAEPELENASGTDYMVEHWLACYAVLYLS